MRTKRVEVGSWVPAVLSGVLFGVGMGVATKHDGSSWTSAGLGALVCGVPFGLAMRWWSARQQRAMKNAEGDLPADKVRLAHRAAVRGPVPSDEEVRSAALRVAARHLADYTGRSRWLFIVAMVFLLIGSVAGGVSESPWDFLGALLPATLLYTWWYWPRRLRRRITSLAR